MKQISNLFIFLIVAILFCTSCQKSVVDSIYDIYEDGIDKVENAQSLVEVKKCFVETNMKVEEYKQSHLRDIATLGSETARIDEAKQIFTKACCVKAYSFDNGYIQDMEGVTIAINAEGKVVPLENLEEDNNQYSDDMESDNIENQNPLGIVGFTPEYEFRSDGWGHEYWYFKCIEVHTSSGDLSYSDEDAETYYEQYVDLFFLAYEIAKGTNHNLDKKIIDYLKKHFTDIISNLPIDDSYPDYVRDYVNEQYYNSKDELNTAYISERGYGYIKCSYHPKGRKNSTGSFYLERDKYHNGRLIIRDHSL